ncbi:MAG: hypothetical protein PF442_11875 [Desulfobulbaceae bacterium]|nr:hypothetical protein [Desulfobulbaceae bacterium]
MNTHKQTLQINYEIKNLSILYKSGQSLWNAQNTSFLIPDKNGSKVGYLQIWVENIKPEFIKDELIRLNEKFESFILGMQFIGNTNLTWEKIETFYFIDTKKPFNIQNDTDIEAIIKRSRGEEFNYLHSYVNQRAIMTPLR